ncbi:hypothetical protein Tco_1034059 [Tanacetum coccineum]
MSKQRFASQVDVNKNLSKPVTQHYLPKKTESTFAKPDHMIASSSSRNSSKNMPRFSSNDMVHNHYLDVAKKKIQERDRNSTTSVPTSARIQTTTDDRKPNPRSNNQTSRSLPVSKSSRVTITAVPKADHSKSSSSFSDSKNFVCSTCHKCVFNANHDACITTPKEVETTVEFSKSDGLGWKSYRKVIDSLHKQGTSINVQKEQGLDLSACTLCNINKENLIIKPRTSMSNGVLTKRFKPRTTMSTKGHQAAETVTTSKELDVLFGPLFDKYFNGENQVVLKSSAVTTTDASNKRQQQPDSTSSTSTLAITVTANGNFYIKDVYKRKKATKIVLTLEQSQQVLEMTLGLDDGVAASFQRSRIHKPHALTQAFKVNHSMSR